METSQEKFRIRMRALHDSYYDIQEMRIRVENRIRAGEIESAAILSMASKIRSAETEAKEEMLRWAEAEPIYSTWLSNVKGIGHVLMIGLLALFGYCENFDTVSKLWAYCGLNVISRCRNCGKRVFADGLLEQQWVGKILARLRRSSEMRKVKKTKFDEAATRKKLLGQICRCDECAPYQTAPRRKKGELVEWNPAARVLAWKIGGQFVKASRGKYRLVYEHYRANIDSRPDLQEGKGAKGHRFAMAKRKTVKLFLSHYWEMTRELKGLPVRPPYAMEYMKHKNYIPPLSDDNDDVPEVLLQYVKEKPKES